MAIAPLAPADPVCIGSYRLTGRLGSGGQGVVYQAQSDDAGPVALKALHPAWLADPTARQRLASEVAAARRVAPFCTARVLAADLDGDQPYIVSEFIPGRSLAEQVGMSGPLSGTVLDRLAVGTMTALLAVHEAGLVHRDVKPSNVILGPDGPRLVDFGIARDAAGHLTSTGTVLGTPAFMAPEQVDGAPVTPATDIFSWAATMTFAATGSSPFEAGQPSATMYRVSHGEADLSAVPPDLSRLLRECLAKDPAWRPSAQQVLMRLVGRPALAAGSGVTQEEAREVPRAVPQDVTQALFAHTATLLGTPPAPGRRSRGPLLLAAAGAVSLAAAIALVVMDRSPAGSAGTPAPPARVTVTASPSPLVLSGGSALPAGFAGSWQGTVLKLFRSVRLQVRLTAGSNVGEQVLEGCRSALVLQEVSADGRSVTFVGTPTEDPGGTCGGATELTLTRAADAATGTGSGRGTLSVRIIALRNPLNSATGSVSPA